MSEFQTMLGLKEPLRSVVSRKFLAAYKANDILFSETTLTHLRSSGGGASFQLRYCPALGKKPKGDEKSVKKDTKGPRFDPFAAPPAELLVANIPTDRASHILVLNKYPVIQNHFIIATKSNKPQTDLLEQDDLRLTYACLHAWEDEQSGEGRRRLFAFFNSGEHSGASQPHRHLQFLPVEDISQPDSDEWGLLTDRMSVRAHPDLPLFQDPALPFLHFATPLQKDLSPSSLYSRYTLLLRAALSASKSPGRPLDESLAVADASQAILSYNLAMTTDRMAICPRRNEAATIPGAGPESSVALNGTVLAGTLMVKDEEEWDVLRQKPALLDGVLTSIAYPPTSWSKSQVDSRI